jgi:hypothetical protein
MIDQDPVPDPIDWLEMLAGREFIGVGKSNHSVRRAQIALPSL